MSQELLRILNEKVQKAIDTMELFQIENDDLKREVQGLKEEKSRWESQLSQLIEKLEGFDQAFGSTEDASFRPVGDTEFRSASSSEESTEEDEYRQAIAS